MKSPHDLDLPFDDWRPGQPLAIRTILHSKTEHTVIQAPTGAGKTAIVAGALRLDDRRQVVLTSTLGLQDQYADQLGDVLADVRGMAQYECLAARPGAEHASYFRFRRTRVMCDDGPCRSGAPCSLKDNGCLYFDKTREFLAAQAGVTSYKKWLYARRFGKGLGIVQRLLCDEAHDLADELMTACTIEIPGDIVPQPLLKTAAKWAAWAADAADRMKPVGETDDTRIKRARLVESLQALTKIDRTWAWDQQQNGTLVFEPTVPKLLLPYMTDRGVSAQVVYLSATITPATLRLLDIPDKAVTFHQMKSRFPVERRPVYLVDAGRVDYKMQEAGREFWLSRIDKIISKRLDRKGIIHSVSYARAQDILAGSRYRGIMIAPRRSTELAAAIDHFRRIPRGTPAILVSPSVVQGFDFAYGAAEYQILAKTPFPDTRSRIMKARIKATPGYREHHTMQKIVQMAGRVVRAADDQGECVAPWTRILTDDLQWVQAGSLREGQRLLAFDESGHGHTGRRKWRWSTVVKAVTWQMPRVRVVLSDGTNLVCTPNHPWLISARKKSQGWSRMQTWLRTDKLELGDQMIRLLRPWEAPKTVDEGWLGGFYDGEGCLVSKISRRNPNVSAIILSQNKGILLQHAKSLLDAFGFTYSMRRKHKCRQIRLTGGVCANLRLLGQIRPIRLLDKFMQSDRNEDLRRVDIVTVARIEQLNDGPITSLQTSTETFVAEGFGAHNTFICDNHFRDWFYGLALREGLVPGFFEDAVQAVTSIPDPPKAL